MESVPREIVREAKRMGSPTDAWPASGALDGKGVRKKSATFARSTS